AVREVVLEILEKLRLLLGRDQREEKTANLLAIPDRAPLNRRQRAIDAQHRCRIRRHVKVGSTILEHRRQSLVELGCGLRAVLENSLGGRASGGYGGGRCCRRGRLARRWCRDRGRDGRRRRGRGGGEGSACWWRRRHPARARNGGRTDGRRRRGGVRIGRASRWSGRRASRRERRRRNRSAGRRHRGQTRLRRGWRGVAASTTTRRARSRGRPAARTRARRLTPQVLTRRNNGNLVYGLL